MESAVRKNKRSRFSSIVVFFVLSTGLAEGADFDNLTVGAPRLEDVFARWYVKLGSAGLIDQTSSNLYSQSVATVTVPGAGTLPVAGVGPQTLLVGRGATYSNAYTAVLQAGYFFTPNWSLEVAAGVPVWLKVRITGFSPAGPASGTVLTEVLPAAIPITAVYHFRQFGAFQPYLGLGFEPSFLLALRSGFSTGGSYEPSVGLVLQGGFDYMFGPHWGVFADIKKIFAESTGHATGVDFGPPVGVVPVDLTIKTSGQPWLMTAGLAYRF